MSETCSKRLAWLEGPRSDLLLSVLPVSSSPFHSAILRLLQGVYDEFHDEKFFYLRRRIFLNFVPMEWEYRLLRVCAKRFEVITDPDHWPTTEAIRWDDPYFCPCAEASLTENLTHEEVVHRMSFLDEAKSAVPLFLRPRRVSAYLCDEDGRVIEQAENTNQHYRFAHAEFNLFYKIHVKQVPIPPRSRLYVSLKPCMMCAALIETLAPADLHVVALEDDPGKMARHSYLRDRLAILRPNA